MKILFLMIFLGVSWNLNFSAFLDVTKSEETILSSKTSDKFLLYPNPATTELNIEMGESLLQSVISINDMSGRKLLMLPVNRREIISIPLDKRFTPGDYEVTIMNGKRKTSSSFKVIE